MIFLAAAMAVASPATDQTKPIPYPKTDLSACSGAATADAMTCRALAAQKVGDYAASATEFEGLATRLDTNDPVARDRALAAAGNMWLAGNQPSKAAAALDKALDGKTLTGQQLGLAQLDRARTALASGDLKGARSLVSLATASIAGDPFLYYFSAVLAQEENDLPMARSAINRALSMAPSSAEVLLEAGNIAAMSSDSAEARNFWTKAVAAGPTSAAGRTAREQLDSQEIPLTVTNQVATQPDGDGEGPPDPQ